MWFASFLILIAVIAAVIAIVTAGGFAIILLIIAIIAFLIGAGGFAVSRRSSLLRNDAGATETVTRMGGAGESGPGREPATPDELVNARRAAQ
jgi:hypothetical protein